MGPRLQEVLRPQTGRLRCRVSSVVSTPASRKRRLTPPPVSKSCIRSTVWYVSGSITPTRSGQPAGRLTLRAGPHPQGLSARRLPARQRDPRREAHRPLHQPPPADHPVLRRPDAHPVGVLHGHREQLHQLGPAAHVPELRPDPRLGFRAVQRQQGRPARGGFGRPRRVEEAQRARVRCRSSRRRWSSLFRVLVRGTISHIHLSWSQMDVAVITISHS